MPEAAAREQSRLALDRANHVRTTNARTIREIKSYEYGEGLSVVADILRHGDMDAPIGTLPVWRLLTAVRGLGESKAEAALEHADVFRMRRPLRTLRVRQRHLLAEALDELGSSWRRR